MMSGTSIDGIDAVLINFFSETEFNVVASQFTAFPAALRNAISETALNNADLTRESDSPLHHELASYYAQAVISLLKKSNTTPNSVNAIANHGQTVKHEPNASPPYSLQLGDGQLLANLTGIETISQFRQADLAAGGQGAPLMPAFHNRIFLQGNENRFVLNLGGIANITCIDNPPIGFYTGPSNCLLDQWIERHQKEHYDENGEWAASGTIIESVLAKLLRDPFLHAAFPKSTGTDHYNLAWLNKQIDDLENYAPKDIQATLVAFTTHTIKLALKQLKATHGDIFVCGGGAKNEFLMSSLATTLPSFSIKKTDALGVPCDLVEAIGFAWLGYCKLHNIPSNLPSVTGASKKLVLGKHFTPS